ncbi:MAG: EutN/CcmL family microcompartment protein [Kiritimatiellia bacterium]|jgi:microcompartment protein CcmK/EutM|nr:EutN/CcmL family microcompartment protein [Kiritimatiellia bacterium]
MILAKIIGDVVSDHKIDDYAGLKMLIVQPIDPDGTPKGKTFLAVDGVQAGVGDTVLIMDEGGSARMLLEEPDIFTIRAVVAGIVDQISMETEE